MNSICTKSDFSNLTNFDECIDFVTVYGCSESDAILILGIFVECHFNNVPEFIDLNEWTDEIEIIYDEFFGL